MITKEALLELGILKEGEYETLIEMTKKICGIVKDILAERGLDLYDIKLEFGRDIHDDIMLIDEISGGNMRVYKDKQYIEPLELEKFILAQ